MTRPILPPPSLATNNIGREIIDHREPPGDVGTIHREIIVQVAWEYTSSVVWKSENKRVKYQNVVSRVIVWESPPPHSFQLIETLVRGVWDEGRPQYLSDSKVSSSEEGGAAKFIDPLLVNQPALYGFFILLLHVHVFFRTAYMYNLRQHLPRTFVLKCYQSVNKMCFSLSKTCITRHTFFQLGTKLM